jgi:thiamine-phosphate pyrophosphorylase
LNKKILRILDANANRCREGLRVVEDIARFVVKKKRVAALAKRLRHRVTTGMAGLGVSPRDLLSQRDSETDSGRPSWGLTERGRRNLAEILACNLHRAQEAARVLEEFGKLLSPRAARMFKEARYGMYTLEKRMLAPYPSRKKQPFSKP